MNLLSPYSPLLLMLSASLLGVAGCMPDAQQQAACDAHRLWTAYARQFIQADGRVIEHSAGGRSTSEGQAYSLFFSLVANDRERFDAILAWTGNNLAGGDLTARLPAWLWGRRDDGSWGVIDANSASDADTWLAYTLLQAGSLWGESRYTHLGALLLAQIRQHEVEDVPGVGPVLLPGPQGFRTAAGERRLNPSYLAIPLFRAFADFDPDGPWQRLADNSALLIQRAARGGFVPDWFMLRDGGAVLPDPVTGELGSYDAIRVYLWAGMLDRQDPLGTPLLAALGGMRDYLQTNTAPPLQVRVQSGTTSGAGPAGFSAALLPYLQRLGAQELVVAQQRRVAAQTSQHLVGTPPRYYDQNLALFAQWWMAGRYAFATSGRLVLDEEGLCVSED
jgi:endo-1,4-beta-D-glucanase Y